MDSLTQATLGAAVAEATLGKKLGNRAILWGAFLGILPDLDLLFTFWISEIQSLRIHRGLSHSILLMLLVPYPIAKLLQRLHPSSNLSVLSTALAVFLIWFTHVLIDLFTSYGTQIFEPFSDYRASTSNLFIIDLQYTLPLLVPLYFIRSIEKTKRKRRWLNYSGLIISSLYVLWSFTAKAYSSRRVQDLLAEQGLAHSSHYSSATPFNTLLWRHLVTTKNGYWSMHHSVLHPDQLQNQRFIPRNETLIAPYLDLPDVQTALWFTRGYYTISIDSETDLPHIHTLHIGQHPLHSEHGNYKHLFNWKLEKNSEGTIIVKAYSNRPTDYIFSLKEIWQHIFKPPTAEGR